MRKRSFYIQFMVLAVAMIFLSGCGDTGYTPPPDRSEQSGEPTDKDMPQCIALQTYTGNYITAVGGGGKLEDVIHTDASQINAWETFTLVDLGGGEVALQTYTGNYITAVGGGGKLEDVIHTDASQINVWETFTLVDLGGGEVALQTYTGNYITAVDGGGKLTDVIHTDGKHIDIWETFRLVDLGDNCK